MQFDEPKSKRSVFVSIAIHAAVIAALAVGATHTRNTARIDLRGDASANSAPGVSAVGGGFGIVAGPSLDSAEARQYVGRYALKTPGKPTVDVRVGLVNDGNDHWSLYVLEGDQAPYKLVPVAKDSFKHQIYPERFVIFENSGAGGIDFSFRGDSRHAERAPPDPVWRVAEEMRIDGNKEEFSVPNAFLLVDRNGGLAFADRRRMQVRFYDRNGKHVRDIGGRGGGPGEFPTSAGGTPIKIGSLYGGLIGDSLWYYDQLGRHLTTVTNQGNLLRSVALAPLPDVDGASTTWRPLAVYSDGSMLGYRTTLRTATSVTNPSDIVLVSPDAKRVRTLVALAQSQSIVVRNRLSGKDESFSVRGSARPEYDVSQDGNRIVVVEQDIASQTPTMRLTVLSPFGDTIATRRSPLEAIPADGLDRDLYSTMLRRDLEAANKHGRTYYETSFIDEVLRKVRAASPRFVAPVSYVRIGIDNTIWLAMRIERDSQPWLVLSPNGEPLGTVNLPSNSTGAGFLFGAASRDQIWRIESDEDGVPSIVRYRVIR